MKFIENYSNDIYNVTKHFLKQNTFIKKISFYKNIKQKLISTQHNNIISIVNISCAPNKHIKMISEESNDTEDWSNDAENSLLRYHRNKLHFNISIAILSSNKGSIFLVTGHEYRQN